MSSNMIKAYSIAYDMDKIKKLNMEERESRLDERIRELIPAQQVFAEQMKSSDEFVQGLPAEDLGDIEIQQEPVVSEKDMEAIKASLREEIMADMQPILQRKGDDIIANARAQAEGLLEAAKKDAEIAKESILKMASAQGYEEGIKRAKEEEEKARKEFEDKKLQLQQEYDRQISELEPAFVKILIELVKKVTNVAYDNHKDVLLYLIDTGLEYSQKDTGFTVVLSEEDYKKYSSLFAKIQEQYKDKYELDFKKDADLPDGSCKLENENRVIDCGLGVRLNGLLEELSLLGL